MDTKVNLDLQSWAFVIAIYILWSHLFGNEDRLEKMPRKLTIFFCFVWLLIIIYIRIGGCFYYG